MADEKRKERLLNTQQVQDELGISRSRGGRKKTLNKRQLEQKLAALVKKRATTASARCFPLSNPWMKQLLAYYDKQIQKLKDQILRA